jgi:hypothetical protein
VLRINNEAARRAVLAFTVSLSDYILSDIADTEEILVAPTAWILVDFEYFFFNKPTRIYAASLSRFRDHTGLDTMRSVYILFTRDRPVAETAT